MHHEMFPLKCSIVRGGTSKGIFVMENELPTDETLRNKYIREIFGSPDVRQIDGLGGADVLTSKLAIIGPPTRGDADVDYTFAQVSFTDEVVDFNSNCGNISAGVAPFALLNGLVRPVEPITTVRIHQVNTSAIITARMRVKEGKPLVDGDEHIDGVPIDGSPIELDFSGSVGSLTGKLLPTGNAIDIIETSNGKKYEVSMVDAAIPVVFIEASALSMSGIEKPVDIEANDYLMNTIEEIRGRCAQEMRLVRDWKNSEKESSYAPFFAVVSPSADYDTYEGRFVKKDSIDLVSRLVFMQRMHKTHPGTGTVCMSAAARVPGSVVNRVISASAKNRERIVIGHPAGVIPVVSELVTRDGAYALTNASILRTARIIMEGSVYLRYSRVR